ncbi:MAG: hypothetical protein JXB62_15445 [Pirellulales bacterium]|nr:hypothetical protein [Pirellulales bacterium]
MNRFASFAVVALAVCGGSLSAEEPAWEPFPIEWNARPDSPASVAFLHDRPAGRDGFIRVEGGHLVRPSGDRFRIWGVNITAKATIPAKEVAPRLADHLARLGINCVRLHFLDRVASQGLIAADRNDTCALDPAQLDQLDFFITQLRDRGIYTNLNLNVGRIYKAGDGVRDHELLGFAKALTYFDPRLFELQKQYARQLLTHRNTYTGNEYRHEPAVAVVELVNENSIVESWFSNRLLGKNTRKNPGTWTDIPASYEEELTERYNGWLGEHISPEQFARLRAACGVSAGERVPRLRPAEFASAAKERFYTEARFYMDLERRYFDEMAGFLRDELDVKPLLVGTSDHNHGKSGYPLLTSTSRLDVVDGHVYWQHPRYLRDPATGRQTGFEIPNTPMVNDPLRSTVVQLSRSAVADKPYTVSEVNHPFPNEYACEGIPILTAYAALHDWDGLFWYTLAHNHLIGADARAIGHFDLGPDPVKMTQLAAGALLFLRADVRPAGQTVGRSYSTDQVYESLRLPWSESPYFTPGFPTALALTHATRITSLDGPPTGPFEQPKGEPFVSDTQQLRWTGAAAGLGVVVVETARSQAIVGFTKENSQATENLSFRPDNPFSAVTLGALDEKPIAEADRLLLTTSARVSNSGMQWSADRRTLQRWGTPPSLIEPVTGAVTLRNLADAAAVSCQPLDGVGQPVGPPLQATYTDRGWSLPIGHPATTWYLVTVLR